MELPSLQRVRRLLAHGIAAISGLLWIANQIFNFREMLRMNVPVWFWSVVFAGTFFIAVIGALAVQSRELESLKQQPQATSAPTVMQKDDQAGQDSQEQSTISSQHQKQPESPGTPKPDLKEALRTAIDGYLFQAKDMQAALASKNDYTISSTLKDHIREWGHSVHQYFRNAIPGRAAAFVDDLPQLSDSYGRSRSPYRKEYVEYLNARIADLESFRKEWNL